MRATANLPARRLFVARHRTPAFAGDAEDGGASTGLEQRVDRRPAPERALIRRPSAVAAPGSMPRPIGSVHDIGIDIHVDIRPADRTAVLTPAASPFDVAMVQRVADHVATTGTADHLETSAVLRGDAAVFEAAGFSPVRELLLLVSDLSGPEREQSRRSSTVRLRTTPRRRAHDVLTVDARAFDPQLRLGRAQLDAAYGATPSARLRTSRGPDDAVTGYALVGRSGRRGYVQRLAVDPTDQGHGLGRALLTDGLRWCRNKRVARALVNTDATNHAALALYRSAGFTDTGERLVILERRLTVPTEPSTT